MKTHSLTLLVAAVVGAFALFATPAEAGDRRRHHRHHDNDCYRGGRNEFRLYQRARHFRPRYYQPVRYIPAPALRIGFVVGDGNGYRHCR
jgi:hypothetical protein